MMSWIIAAIGDVLSTGYLVLKELIAKTVKTQECQCGNRVRGKVVVITGATSGIGQYTARDLALKGAVVYIAGRNSKVGQQLVQDIKDTTGNQAVSFLYLDLTDLASIRPFVEAFLKCEQKLDVLVNNAGVFHHPPKLTQDEIEVTFQTNYLGGFLLTSLLLDTIKVTQGSRIIFVSSEAHKLVNTADIEKFDPSQPSQVSTFLDHVHCYGISKLALRLYADLLAQNFPEILVVQVNPGNVWTPIYRHAWLTFKDVLKRFMVFCFMKSVEKGSQSLIHALNATTLPTGSYISDHLEVEEKQEYSAEATVNLMRRSAKLVAKHNLSASEITQCLKIHEH